LGEDGVAVIVEKINAYLENTGKSITDEARKALDIAVEQFGYKTRKQFLYDRENRPGHLYATALTHPCSRKAAYNYFGFKPDEELTARVIFNFWIGDTVELGVLLVARLAGCDVGVPSDFLKMTGPWEQREKMKVKWNDVELVCYPDGVVRAGVGKDEVYNNLEVKKMSEFAFDQMERTGELDDAWGYKSQVMLEVLAWRQLGINVTGTQFVACRGLTGKLGEWHIPFETSYVGKVFERHTIVTNATPDKLPDRAFVPVLVKPKRKGGEYREKLALQCSYCPMKRTCWNADGRTVVTEMERQKPVFYLESVEKQKLSLENMETVMDSGQSHIMKPGMGSINDDEDTGGW